MPALRMGSACGRREHAVRAASAPAAARGPAILSLAETLSSADVWMLCTTLQIAIQKSPSTEVSFPKALISR